MPSTILGAGDKCSNETKQTKMILRSGQGVQQVNSYMSGGGGSAIKTKNKAGNTMESIRDAILYGWSGKVSPGTETWSMRGSKPIRELPGDENFKQGAQ